MSAQQAWLPWMDRLMVQSAAVVVPVADRRDWLRCWRAELWHRRHPRSGCVQSAADLYPGLVRDALWMRRHAWQQAMEGTAALCLLMLAAALFLTVAPRFLVSGGTGAMLAWAQGNAMRFLCEALPVLLVGFAVSSRSVRYDAAAGSRLRVHVHLFALTKTGLALLIAFAFSADVASPLVLPHPLVADLVQVQVFVFFGLLALRWSFDDQEKRCKHCLRRGAGRAPFAQLSGGEWHAAAMR